MKLVDLLAGSGPWYRWDRRRRSRTLPDSRVRFSAPGLDSRLESSSPAPGRARGADLGGLVAQNAGAGNKTWRAYLSTQAAGGSQARHCHVSEVEALSGLDGAS